MPFSLALTVAAGWAFFFALAQSCFALIFPGRVRAFLIFIGVFGLLCAPCAANATDDFISAGPLFESFPLSLNDGARAEAAGPFFYDEQRGPQGTWAIPPLLSSPSDPETDWREFDLAYPILTYDRFGQEYRFQFLQLISFSGGGMQTGETKDRFTLFPFYFQQRSADSNQNYTALWPLYGNLRNRFLRDEIDFALWPLYVKTIRRPGQGAAGADEYLPLSNSWAHCRRGDITTYNFVAPIFHLRYGDGLSGWQFWPLVGHEQKDITTRTNSWGDAETVPGHERTFALWPIMMDQTRDIGTTNTSHFKAFIPFYTSLRSRARDSTSYLWPFGLTLTEDRARDYRQTDFLWPIFSYARGEGKTTTRFWPLFSQSRNATLERNFYLWPLFKFSRTHADPLDRSRTQILFFLYSDAREKNTATGKDSRRVDLWPLFSHVREKDGNTRLQLFSLLEPIFSSSKSIERNYSPLWSVWRTEHNPNTGSASQSLLWNLYRHQVTPGGTRRTSFLFGLFQRESSPAGSALRLFYIPFKNSSAKEVVPKVDSPPRLAHPAPGVQP